MNLSELRIHHLRNLSDLQFSPHAHLNLIYGKNGSGKTSILESIYLLGSGHSFRTREIASLVSEGSEEFIIFAKCQDGQQVSLSKSLSNPTRVLINKMPCSSSSELARLLPNQVFYQDIFQIIDAGPNVRRNVIDWGLFHVEHDYHQLWKEYKRALKQRNALLRQQADHKQLNPWNKLLAELGEQIHQYRTQYFSEYMPYFHETLAELTELDITLSYLKGWDRKGENKSLHDALSQNIAKDIQRQYTAYGAHNADLSISIKSHKAKQFLSRGQQKIVLFALKFAQTKMLDKECIYLIDDIHAELDTHNLNRLIDYIKRSKGQFYITFHEDVLLAHHFNDVDFNQLHLECDYNLRL